LHGDLITDSIPHLNERREQAVLLDLADMEHMLPSDLPAHASIRRSDPASQQSCLGSGGTCLCASRHRLHRAISEKLGFELHCRPASDERAGRGIRTAGAQGWKISSGTPWRSSSSTT